MTRRYNPDPRKPFELGKSDALEGTLPYYSVLGHRGDGTDAVAYREGYKEGQELRLRTLLLKGH